MQGSHTHIPGTNHVPRGYIVAAILSLLLMVPLCLVPALVLLFFYVSTFRSMCAVPNMAVFCSSLTSWFHDMSLTYFLNDLEMVPVAPIITGITLVFTFHMRCIIIIIIIMFFNFSFLTFLPPTAKPDARRTSQFSATQDQKYLRWCCMCQLVDVTARSCLVRCNCFQRICMASGKQCRLPWWLVAMVALIQMSADC